MHMYQDEMSSQIMSYLIDNMVLVAFDCTFRVTQYCRAPTSSVGQLRYLLLQKLLLPRLTSQWNKGSECPTQTLMH